MAELFLVRHAQAAFGTDDYDRLSPLGRMQAEVLGHYLRDCGIQFDAVFSGDLLRQKETARLALESQSREVPHHVDPRFNEIQNAGKRKRVIDIATLMRLLKVDSRESLIALQNRLLNDEIENSQRNSIWTESIAVGDAEYLQEIKCNLGPRGKYRNIESADGFRVLREFSGLYCTISGNKLSD